MGWIVACFCGNTYTTPPNRCEVCGGSVAGGGGTGEGAGYQHVGVMVVPARANVPSACVAETVPA